MTNVKNFSEWWAINGAEYEKNGINRIMAKSIWDAAVDVFFNEIQRNLPAQ
jgi:hypothetical protein